MTVEHAGVVKTTTETMRQDADLLTEQALRLRDAAETIRDEPGVPIWFDETIRNQIGRCVVAAEDLRLAADLLEEHEHRIRVRPNGREPRP